MNVDLFRDKVTNEIVEVLRFEVFNPFEVSEFCGGGLVSPERRPVKLYFCLERDGEKILDFRQRDYIIKYRNGDLVSSDSKSFKLKYEPVPESEAKNLVCTYSRQLNPMSTCPKNTEVLIGVIPVGPSDKVKLFTGKVVHGWADNFGTLLPFDRKNEASGQVENRVVFTSPTGLVKIEDCKLFSLDARCVEGWLELPKIDK